MSGGGLELRQEFVVEMAKASNNRKLLLSLMDTIDEEKRSVKQRLKQVSSDPKAEDPVGGERESLIRGLKDKESYLKAEREVVRNRLGEVSEYKRSMNYLYTPDGEQWMRAFYVAAQHTLSESVLKQCEDLAGEISNIDRVNE